jgi:hypothetical protein
VPEPLDHVATEDPILTSGTVKVAMWSYPVIQDGLIYVVDVRNGLYVLRYEGRSRKRSTRSDSSRATRTSVTGCHDGERSAIGIIPSAFPRRREGA